MAERMDPRQLSRISGLALAIGLALVGGVLIPVLIFAGWLMLTALFSGAGLVAAIERVIALLAIVLGLGESLMQELQIFLAANPGLLALMLGLIPVSLIWLIRFAPRKRATDPVS
jgi:hypothetical protein